MPAFVTPTGLPYPRVNLRHGVPFYANSPLNMDPEHGQCAKVPMIKIQKLPRPAARALAAWSWNSLPQPPDGNRRYEKAAKNAFWAVWQRRSSIGLIGAGIDAETGQWVSPYTVSVLASTASLSMRLSRISYSQGFRTIYRAQAPIHPTLSWLPGKMRMKVSNARSIVAPQHQHPHYAQVDLYTGALRPSGSIV